MTATNLPVLAFAQVGFAHPGGPPVLRDVSLSLAAGDGVALVGHNGAGKSTLLRLAMALHHPVTGHVLVGGRDTRALASEVLAATVGFAFQDPGAQLFERSVERELAFGPRQLGWTSDRLAARLDEVLARLRLDAVRHHHPYDLPAPQRKVVSLGAALMVQPALLLLDEPTAGLDRASRQLVESVVRDERARGAAVLAVTHDASFAVECLDEAIRLERGAVRARGAVLELMDGEKPVAAMLARRLGFAGEVVRRADVARRLAAG